MWGDIETYLVNFYKSRQAWSNGNSKLS
jgi:hypothetical protein